MTLPRVRQRLSERESRRGRERRMQIMKKTKHIQM